MTQDDRKNMDLAVNFRMFQNEFDSVMKCVIYCETPEGWRKYENISHFIRCAIMRLLNQELLALEVKRGRPKKYNDKGKS